MRLKWPLLAPAVAIASAAHVCNPDQRWDCAPDQEIDEAACLARNCCWFPLQENSDRPWCFYAENQARYKLADEDDFTFTSMGDLFWPRQVNRVKLNLRQCTTTADKINIYRLVVEDTADPNRYKHTEVPNIECNQVPDPRSYELGFGNTMLKLEYAHISDTFVFSDQFLQMSLKLDNDWLVYGIGERRGAAAVNAAGNRHFRHGIWNRDQFPAEHTNLYGDQPIWVADGKDFAVGCIWWNSNAKSFEVKQQQAGNDTMITMRSNGGMFDLFFIFGHSPHDVVKSIHTILGPPAPMPDWALGYQLCRWGYDSAERTMEGTFRLPYNQLTLTYSSRRRNAKCQHTTRSTVE